jgi:hypothetical protein
MAERKFEDIQRELDETIWNLKGTRDQEFQRLYLKKLRRLADEADRLLSPPNRA